MFDPEKRARVHAQRQDYARVTAAEYKEMYESWALEHTDLIHDKMQAAEQLKAAEATLRADLLQYFLFGANGERTFAPGLAVQMRKKLVVDDEDALMEWCYRHRLALSVNLDGVELAIASGLRPAGAHIAEVPTATISPDISKELRKAANTRELEAAHADQPDTF